MSYSDDRQGNSTGGLTGQSVTALSEAASGELHLLVTFETLAGDRGAEGGDASEPAFGTADADAEPFVESVRRPARSSGEYSDSAFGETVDVESLVSYLGLDFVEHQLFADRFRLDADVVYTSRGVGSYQLLCVYLAGRGLLLVVDDDEAIRPLVGRARSLLTET